MTAKFDCIVIGGGIAGISTAFHLIKKNKKVLLLESTNRLGGRCYSFQDKYSGEIIDNGQHIFAGAYSIFFEILKELGTFSLLTKQKQLEIVFNEYKIGKYQLRSNKYLGKAGIVWGLFKMENISFTSKIKLIKFFINVILSKNDFKDKSVADLLSENKQNTDIIERFWNPLVLAVMNSDPQNSSAEIFVNTLKKSFFGKANTSALYFANNSLGALISPFHAWCQKSNSEVQFEQLVKNIIVDGYKALGVETASGDIYFADKIISALPFDKLLKILPQDLIKLEFFKKISNLEYSPILSAYLWLDKPLFEYDFTALIGTKIQWIFNRNKIISNYSSKLSKNVQSIAITISNAGELINMDKSELLNIFINELKLIFPDVKDFNILHSVIIKEKKATLKPSVQNEKFRPNNFTPFENLYICGAWTSTGLPSTIEGAALSGKTVAERIQ